MKFTILILTIFLTSCVTADKTNNLFDDLANKTSVVIYLSKHGLDSVPKEIGRLKAVKKLYITKDSAKGWTIYPPLFAIDPRTEKPPFRQLPNEITELSSLHLLALIDLDLKTLPDNFDKLENLDTLSLFMNKLTISNETEKLKKLKKLKYLDVVGNNVDSIAIQELKTAIPGIMIKSRIE